MTTAARNPDEHDALLEDAFVVGDRAALDALFADGFVLVAEGGLEALWTGERTYVAQPARVLRAKDVALAVSVTGVHVLRRDADGAWRAAISLLDTSTTEED